MADPVERYLELGLRLGRHADDLVDSYYGPAELASRVEAEELREPAALAERRGGARRGARRRPRGSPAQVRGARARAPASSPARSSSYAEEGRLVYGIEPRWHDEEPFRPAAAHARRGAAGQRRRCASATRAGSSRPRSRRELARAGGARRGRRAAAPDAASDRAAGGRGVRARARDRRALARLRATTSAACGRGSAVNTDLPLPAADLVTLTSHEIYGGHHTHRVWQEVELVRGQGQLERTLDAALVARGGHLGGHRDDRPGAPGRRRAGARGGGARPARLRLRRRGRRRGS